MARRRAKAPRVGPDPNADVFDSAAPPPPQAFVKPRHATTVPKPGAGAVGGPAASAPGALPPAAGAGAAAAGAGPWYTCGLGAGLLAQSPVLFALAVLLTYSAGLGILAALLWLLLALCCGDPCEGCEDGCCAGSGGSGGSGGNSTAEDPKDTPAAGVVAVGGGLASALGLRGVRWGWKSLAHHPDLPEFEPDVWRWAGARWCVGCFTVYPVFTIVSAALLAEPGLVPWTLALGAGLVLACVQAVSSFGLTRARAAKVAVKCSLAVGMALAFHGILAAPWPRAGQVATLLGLLLAAAASALPRRRRIRAALARDDRHDP